MNVCYCGHGASAHGEFACGFAGCQCNIKDGSLVRVNEKYKGMMDHPLNAVEFNEDKTQLIFTFEEGLVVKFETVGDCCSQSWFESLELDPDCIGEKDCRDRCV